MESRSVCDQCNAELDALDSTAIAESGIGGRSATNAERERYAKWEHSWEKQHPLVQPPQYGLIFDAWDDIVEQSFSDWRPASELQNRMIQKVFDRFDELAHGLPNDTNTYGERMEDWRRSDFWSMRWEDFD